MKTIEVAFPVRDRFGNQVGSWIGYQGRTRVWDLVLYPVELRTYTRIQRRAGVRILTEINQ